MYDLKDVSISYGLGQPVLSGLTWSSGEQGVEVVFGGGGVGKSSLLRALSGLSPATMRRSGTWRFRGNTAPFDGDRPFEGVVWCGQPIRGFKPSGELWPSLGRALDAKANIILLDEPNAWIDESGYPDLLQRINARAKEAVVLLSTHHVEFGRQCADRVLLLGGGRALAQGSATEFFSTNATEHSKVFVRDGNVVPRRQVSPPGGLRWLLPSRLGGMSKPGLLRPMADDLRSLADLGVTHLVTLTRSVLADARPPDYGIEWHHCPIQDMGVPTVRAAMRICRQIDRWLEQGGSVVVHCRGGMGRTGLVLALVLVQQGHTGPEAITAVRKVNRHYIQTEGQAAFVRGFEDVLRDE